MKLLLWSIGAVVVLCLALVAIALFTDSGPDVIRLGAKSVRDMAFPSEKSAEKPEPAVAVETSKSGKPAPPSTPLSGESGRGRGPAPPTTAPNEGRASEAKS